VVTASGNTGSLVKAGSAFANWNTQADGSGTTYTPDQVFLMGSSNITLYAQWSTTFYTVSFNSQTATIPASPASMSIASGGTVSSLPTVPLRTGYTFGGWFTAVSGGGTEFTTSTVVTGDIIVYAKWSELYTVTYNGNGNTSGTVPIDSSGYTNSQEVSVLGNTGSLVKLQDGISLSLVGWNTQADGSGTDYALASSTYTMGSENITLYAKWSVLRGIGPAGGYIFYAKSSYYNGWRYLEVAPVSTEWTGKSWGSYGTVIGYTSTAIGSGRANTTTIVSWLNSNGYTNRAAQLCDALVSGGYSDWFLPSKDELNKMYVNLYKGTDENGVVYTDVGGFTYLTAYWSSSEYNDDTAWMQGISNSGSQYDSHKQISCSVRAVRAF